MILIKPDPERRVDIAGVPAPVRRPVEIDPSMTAFQNLRTLRIYQFDAGSVIEGHAEEDEVLIVVLAGSIELSLVVDPTSDPITIMMTAAGGGAGSVACAAYLPPGGAYKLVSPVDADVAYARATPAGMRPPQVFHSLAGTDGHGANLLVEDLIHAERLRFRILQFNAQTGDLAFSPAAERGATSEMLVHLRSSPSAERLASISGDTRELWLDSGDTVAIQPGERPTLCFPTGVAGVALVLMAI